LGQRREDELIEEQRRQRQAIGRIPEEQIRELERLQRQQQQEREIARRGKIWAGPPATDMSLASGGVLLSAGGAGVLTDGEQSIFESDVSSIIDISDHFGPSETEDDQDELIDTQKYILPHIGKTNLNIITKEPLSPAERLPTRESSPPTTPRTTRSTADSSYTPPTMGFSTTNWPGMSPEYVSGANVRHRLTRSDSIYTLGRATFTGQLARLTSVRLPEADALARKISSIPSSIEAAMVLSEAHDQIHVWIGKASDVLNGLNAEDDVEWAAAGGREGVAEVDTAINRFERLVEVYISSIEKLQGREDISRLPAQDLIMVAKQMESIITSWKNIRRTLNSIKDQVEIAMDWEDLWNTVLGEIGQELAGLNSLVFEMEEKRHEGADILLGGSKEAMNLDELETIIEEGSGRAKRQSRNAQQPATPITPVSPTPAHLTAIDFKEDSNLLALFARMEPLRASLDFLPMRLSAWSIRGNVVFPTACQDLETRRDQLEEAWNKLSSDANSLRRELGEDKWIQLFRNAGRKALKIYESILRSFDKLKEGIDAGEQQSNAIALSKKVENYEAKKLHYSPAIERVLAIIDRGVLDRLTVNGEILRLQSDLRGRWTALQAQMKELDHVVEEILAENHERQLRDSVSTVVSSERSMGSSTSHIDTPGSSPNSSVLGLSRKSSFQGTKTPTGLISIKTRASCTNLSSSVSSTRKSILPRLSVSSNHSASPSLTPSSTSRATATASTTTTTAWPSRPDPTPNGERPRWTMSAVKHSEIRSFRPLAASEPSPYAKAPTTPKASYLRSTTHPASMPPQIPSIRTSHHHEQVTPTSPPAGRSAIPKPTPKSLPASAPPLTGSARVVSQPLLFSPTPPARSTNRIASSTFPHGSSGHHHQALNTRASTSALRPASRLSPASALSSNNHKRVTMTTDGNEADNESPTHQIPQRRPGSVMGGGGAGGYSHSRHSALPSQAVRAGSRLAVHGGREEGERPKWRP
jgi:hypothetical protein